MKADWFRYARRLSGIRSRRYVAVLVVAAVLLGAGGWQALQLRVTGDISALLPEDAPSVPALNDLQKRFGATNYLIVLFLAPQRKDVSPDLERVAASLGASGYIRKVDYRWEVNRLETQGLYYLQDAKLEEIRDTIKERIRKETLKASPFYVSLDEEEGKEEEAPIAEEFGDLGKVLSEYGEGLALEGDHVYFRKDVDCRAGSGGMAKCDRRVWGMIVTPSRGTTDITYAKALVDDVKERIAATKVDPEVRVLLSGRYNYMATEANDVLKDLNRVSAFGAVAVCGVVLAFFPSLLVLLLVFIPLLLGLALDFGIVRLTIGQLNVVTAGNFAILFGMGVEYGIQVYSRFREETKRGHPY
jgi:predicted RND superfamily exporter protein